MLRYKNIIDSMPQATKLKLLSDIGYASSGELEAYGIPKLKFGMLEEYCSLHFPSVACLAMSCDNELARQVSNIVMRDMDSDGVDIVMLPVLKPQISMHDTALSEDGYISAALVHVFAVEAKRVNMPYGFMGLDVSREGSKWLDREPSASDMFDLIYKPYADATAGGCIFTLTRADSVGDEYEKVNDAFASHVSGDKDMALGYSIRTGISEGYTVGYIRKGEICFGGSYEELLRAYERYNTLAHDLEIGKITHGQLEREKEQGLVISSDELDAALDRVLDLLLTIKDMRHKRNIRCDMDASDVAYRASAASVALIKNENDILPISKKRKRVCVIGGHASDSGFGVISAACDRIKSKGQYSGYRQGYLIDGDTIDRDMIREAVSLAASSDVVILFADSDISIYEHGKKRLPIGAEALADALRPYRNKTVIVLGCGCTSDISFADGYSGLLLAPLNIKEGALAAVDVIFGDICPSGRVVSSMHSDAVSGGNSIGELRREAGLRIGRFTGYKYYEREGIPVGCAFGEGMTYSKFKYFGLTFENGKVRFRVKNSGKHGCDSVFVYISSHSSAAMRPKRVLCGYARIELGTGEEKSVEIDIKADEVYDEKSGRFLLESGKYTISVLPCSRVSEMSCTTVMSGVSILPDTRDESEYFAHVSNIDSHYFKLEEVRNSMKKEIRNKVFGAGALLLAIVLFVFASLSQADTTLVTVVAVILAIAAICMFALDFFDRQKALEAERKAVDAEKAKGFADAKILGEPLIESLFSDDTDDGDIEGDDDMQSDDDCMREIDKSLNIDAVRKDLTSFAASKGIKLSHEMLTDLISAFFSSKMIILRGEGHQSERIAQLLCDYFCLDKNGRTCDAGALSQDERDGAVIDMLKRAKSNKNAIHMISFTGIRTEHIDDGIISFAGYARDPEGRSLFEASGEKYRDEEIYIPHNMWMVLCLDPSVRVKDLPDSLVYTSPLLKISFAESLSGGVPSEHIQLSCAQAEYMLETCMRDCALPEEAFKKIDRLEDYLKRTALLKFGNELCVGMEKYSSVCLACGEDTSGALDRTLASRVLPYIAITVSGKNDSSHTENISDVFVGIFGEDGMYACKELLLAICR